MRRLGTTLLLAIGLAGAVGIQAAHAQVLFFDYVGFDYEDPDAVPGMFGGLGDGYVGVGEIPVPPTFLVTDFTNNEYTYHLTGLIATARVVVSGVAVIDYSGPGTITVYEDSKAGGTHFDYGTDPPNGTAPPSFVDGTAILVAQITNFRYILNLNTGSGSYESDLEVTGGTQFNNVPADQRLGWQFAGVTGNTISVPQGYAHQVDGQTLLQLPTASLPTSWGQLKRKYR